MRALLYTAGSPFARGVRIVLDELAIDYERRDEGRPAIEDEAPTLQVPVFWDSTTVLWESGTIVEYLLATYNDRTPADPPLAPRIYRREAEWNDKLVLATIQSFGTAATTISQLTWTGVGVADNAHLERSARKLWHCLGWLEERLVSEAGFLPGTLSVQDIFLAAHVRFIQARPLGIELDMARYPKIERLLERLDARPSFKAAPIWWWDPDVVAYSANGTPLYEGPAAGDELP